MVVMIAQNQIIQPVFRLHIRQPAHVIRKIFAFKPRQNADLAAVFLRQRAHARQIFRHLTDVHAHRRMHVSVFVRPWHVIRKAQLVKSPLDRRQHIFLIRAFRMPAARRVRVIIRFHRLFHPNPRAGHAALHQIADPVTAVTDNHRRAAHRRAERIFQLRIRAVRARAGRAHAVRL